MTDGARKPVDVPMKRRRSRLGAITLISGRAVFSLLSVAVLVLTWYGWYFVGDVNSGVTTTNVFDTEPETEPLDGAVDILLVGMDSRTDAQGNPLPEEVLAKLHAGEAEGNKQTDTMILVHIPQDGTSAVAISFPRDAWVELAGGYGSNRINSAFVYAYNDTFNTMQARGETDLGEIEEQAKVAGRRNLIATIEQLIGKPGMIDRYAEVNLASFYEVTKALGGIEICLNEPVREPKSGVNLPAGRQTVEGVQALAFVRQRHGLPDGDIDRIARQQAFLSGLARKVLSSDVLLNPSRLGDVIDAVQKSVVISEDWDLLQFANQMRNLSGGNIEFHTIPWVGYMRVGGAEVVEIDETKVRAFVDGLVTDPGSGDPGAGSLPDKVPGAEAFAVDIYNASGDPELGARARELLRGQGFGGESYATVEPQSTTVIRHAPGAEAGVEALRTALGRDLYAEPDPQLPSGTLSVRLGSDMTLPAATSNDPDRLLNRAHPFLSSGAHRTAPSQEKFQDSGTPGGGTQGGGSQDSEEDSPITAGGVPCVN